MIHRLRRVVRAVIVGFGFVLMAVGLVGAFLPTHLAGFLLVLGLILVLRNSIRWRRRFILMLPVAPPAARRGLAGDLARTAAQRAAVHPSAFPSAAPLAPSAAPAPLTP
jgi:hypothetical protein